MSSDIIKIKFLGQVGVLLEIQRKRFMIDPYLTNYVGEKLGAELDRQVPVPIHDSELVDIDSILITHEHEDHCDPNSIEKVASLNSNLTVYAPKRCNSILINIDNIEVINPKVGESYNFADNLAIKCIPSAHTKLEISSGFSRWMGYLISAGSTVMYHPGDTIPYPEIHDYIQGNIDLAFLPVNERNYYREKVGIIGNMTPREAFMFAEELNIKKIVPTHHDMFKPNSLSKEEFYASSKAVNNDKFIWMDSGDTFELKY